MNYIEVMKRARNALNSRSSRNSVIAEAISYLDAAIEQAEKCEPVAAVWKPSSKGAGNGMSNTITVMLPMGTKLYAHPQPAIPECWQFVPAERTCDHLDEFNEVGQAYADGWNACRKALLAAAQNPEP